MLNFMLFFAGLACLSVTAFVVALTTLKVLDIRDYLEAKKLESNLKEDYEPENITQLIQIQAQVNEGNDYGRYE